MSRRERMRKRYGRRPWHEYPYYPPHRGYLIALVAAVATVHYMGVL